MIITRKRNEGTKHTCIGGAAFSFSLSPGCARSVTYCNIIVSYIIHASIFRQSLSLQYEKTHTRIIVINK